MEVSAVNFLWSYVEAEETLFARWEYSDGSKQKYYTVSQQATDVATAAGTLNEALLKEGLALADRRAESISKPLYTRCAEAQKMAQRQHRHIFEFGDIEDEEDA